LPPRSVPIIPQDNDQTLELLAADDDSGSSRFTSINRIIIANLVGSIILQDNQIEFFTAGDDEVLGALLDETVASEKKQLPESGEENPCTRTEKVANENKHCVYYD